jgi:hypothetical protein
MSFRPSTYSHSFFLSLADNATAYSSVAPYPCFARPLSAFPLISFTSLSFFPYPKIQLKPSSPRLYFLPVFCLSATSDGFELSRRITLLSNLRLSSLVTPERLDNLPFPVTPERLDNLPLLVTPERLDNLPLLVTPERLDNLPFPVTPERLDNLPLLVTPERLDNLPIPVTPERLDNLPLLVTPERLDNLPFPVTPERLDNLPLLVTPERLDNLPFPVTPERSENLLFPRSHSLFAAGKFILTYIRTILRRRAQVHLFFDSPPSPRPSVEIHEQPAELHFLPPVLPTQLYHEPVLSRHPNPLFPEPIPRFKRYQRRCRLAQPQSVSTLHSLPLLEDRPPVSVRRPRPQLANGLRSPAVVTAGERLKLNLFECQNSHFHRGLVCRS